MITSISSGPILVMLGVGCAIVGIFLCLSNKKMMRELQARKMRYKSFSSVMNPNQRQFSYGSNVSLVTSITETYEHIIGYEGNNENDENEVRRDADIACFPRSNNNEQIAVTDQNPENFHGIKIKISDEEDDCSSRENVIEIPSSRRSSFHGDSLDVGLSGENFPSLLKTADNLSQNRRSSEAVGSPVETL